MNEYTHRKKLVWYLVPVFNARTTSNNRLTSFFGKLSKYYKLEPGNTSSNLSNAQVLNIKMGRLHWWRHRLWNKLVWGQDEYFSRKLPETDLKNGIVFASGGYFSLFSLASRVASKTQSMLILDYRDMWTYGYRHLNSRWAFYHFVRLRNRRKELKILGQATLITTVSSTLKSYFPEQFQHKIHVIPNGSNYIPEPSDINPLPETFNIVYAGTIYNDQLKEEVFFNAVQIFLERNGRSKVKIIFAGALGNRKLYKMLLKYNLKNISEVLPRLEKDKLGYYLSNASLFLHLRYGKRSGIITSKQADYLAYRKSILLPVSDNGDMEESILTHNAGFVCNGVEETVAVLERQYEKFLRGESCMIDKDVEFLRKNTREYWAEEFVKLVDEVVGK